MTSEAPTQTISDDEASSLYSQYDSADPQQQTLISGVLGKYFDQQDAAKQAATDDHFSKLYTDPDYFAANTNTGPVNEATKLSPDPGQTKQKIVNQAYFANQAGVNPSELDGTTYAAYRDGFAQKFLGKQTATDSEVFSGIAKQQQNALDVKSAVDELPSDVATTAMDALAAGKFVPSAPEMLQAWKDKHPAIPAASGDESGAMDGINRYLQQTVPFIKKYGFDIQAAAKVLGSMGDDARPGDQNDVGPLAASMVNIPPDDRQTILGLASLVAKKNAPAETDGTKVASQVVGSVLSPAFGAVDGASDMEREREAQANINDYQQQNPGDTAGLKKLQDQYDAIGIERDIRAAANGQVNPITPVYKGVAGDVEGAAYGAAGMALPVATTLIPYAGPALTAGAFTAQQYETTRSEYPDLPLDQARGLAALKGGAMAATNYLTGSAALGKLPMTARFFKGLEDAPPSALNMLGKMAATGGEVGLQTGAYIATPTIVDGLAKTLGADMPQFDWNDQLKELKGAEYSGMISALPFFLLGAGAIGIHDVPAIAKTMADAKSITATTGLDPDTAAQIVAEPDPIKKASIFQTAWQKMPDEQKEIVVQRFDSQAQAAQTSQDSSARPTFRSVVGQDDHGAPQQQWAVGNSTGKEVFRSPDQSAALDAYQLQTQHEAAQNIEEPQKSEPDDVESEQSLQNRASLDLRDTAREYLQTGARNDESGPVVINSDRIMGMDPGYAVDASKASEVYPHAAKVADEAYKQALADAPQGGGVTFLAGSPGAGKSMAGDGVRNRAVVVDGTLANYDRSEPQIRAAIDAGQPVSVQYFHKPLEEAVKGTLDRSMDPSVRRSVPVDAIASAYQKSRENVLRLEKEFGDQITVRAYDTTGNNVRPISMDDVRNMPDAGQTLDQLKERANNAVDEWFSENKGREGATEELRQSVRSEGVRGQGGRGPSEDSGELQEASGSAGEGREGVGSLSESEVGEATKSLASGLADQARDDIKNFGPGAANAEEFMQRYAMIGASHIANGITTFHEWAAEMAKDVGDKNLLPEIWERSKQIINDFQSGTGPKSDLQKQIEQGVGIAKSKPENVSVNPVTSQKASLRAQEKAGEAGFKRGVRETWVAAKVKMADLKAQLRNSVSKADSLSRYFAGMEKGAKQATADTRKQLAMADKWLAADVDKYRRTLVDYVNQALPMSERGRFIGLVTKALERPSLFSTEHLATVGKNTKAGRPGYEALVGGRQKLYNAMVAVTEAVDDRVHELYRQGLADDIRKTASRAIQSPTVDLRAKSAIDRILGDINLKNPRASTLESLAKTAEYLQKMREAGKDVEMPSSVLAKLQQLAKTPLDDLPTAVLENLQTKMNLAESIGRTSYKSRAGRWLAEKSQRLGQMISGRSVPMEANPLIRAQPGEKLTSGEKLQNYLNNFARGASSMDLGVLPQDVIFDMLQNGKGTYAGPLFDHIRTPIDAAHDAAMRRYLGVRSGLREIIGRNKLGEQASERIGLWAASKQKGGDGRALDSGVEQATIDKLKSEGLTPGEFEAYNYMRGELDGSLPQVQGVMHDLYNVAVQPERNYFPFMREWESYKPDVESPIKDAVTGESISPDELSAFSQIAGNFYTQGTNKLPQGFTLERNEHAAGPIRFDAFETFERHMVNTSRLIEMQRELKMVGEMVRDDSFGSKYGANGQKLVNEWLTTTANDGGGQSVARWRWLDGLNRGTSRSMVFFNLVSNIKHISGMPMGIINAGGAKHWWSALSKLRTPEAQAFMANFPQVTERNSGELNIEQFQKVVDKANDSTPAQILRAADKYGFWLGKSIDHVNSQTVFLGRYLSNLEAKGKAPVLSGPIDQQAAYNALAYMRRTVSSTHSKDLPGTLARGAGPFGGNVSLARAFFQFHQFVLERWSQMRYDLPKAAQSGDYMKFAGMVAASAAAVLYETNIKNAVDSGMKQVWAGMTGQPQQQQDDSKKEGFLARAAWDTAGLVPYASPILSAARFKETGVPIVDAFLQAGNDVGQVFKAKTTKGKMDAGIRAAGSVAQVAGVPGAGVASRAAQAVIPK